MKRPLTILRGLLDIPTTDPEDARRRRLLSLILVALVALMIVGAVFIPLAALAGLAPPVPSLFYYALPVMLIGTALIYVINRYWSGKAASWVFLTILTASMFTAPPEQALTGHNILAFAIPILMASFLLYPAASYLMAALISVVMAIVGSQVESIGVQISPMLTLFLIALLSWIAASNLENALGDLRVLNRELDARVVSRTQELAEALTREQAEASRSQAILKGIADGVIVFDINGKAIIANPAITDLLGRASEEIVGQSIERLASTATSTEDQNTIAALLRDHESAHSGLKFLWGGKTLSVSMAPVRDSDSQVAGTVAVFRDFTKEAEIDRMKSTFVSIASHELRTPLNAIMGYTELLQEGVYGDLTARQQDAAQRILANTHHMLSLANNLLDRAQIEAGSLELNITSFSPSQVIHETTSAMAILAHHKGLLLTSDVAPDLPAQVVGDRQRVGQIIVNLIGNALKFTEAGGVKVRVRRSGSAHWVIEVSDTGIGISPEAQSYIFEPFRRADESPTREHGGAGLGLSIVRQLVDMMGGKIELKSQVGMGSTFTIELPLSTDEPVAASIS